MESIPAFNNLTNVNGSLAGNFSLSDYILKNLGPKQVGLTSSILLTIIYSLVFISGTIGNVCTCIVIARNSYMQTTTNYYLFSLAVSDLMLLLFGLPPELYAIWESYPWRFGEAYCILHHTLMELTSYASVLTITAFTVERYVAICRPLQAHRMSGLSRCLRIIFVIWIVSILVALPYAIHTRVFHELHHPRTNEAIPESLICNIRTEWRGQMTYMFQISTFLFFVTPVAVIVCLYVLIGVALRRSTLGRGQSDEHRHSGSKHMLPSQPRRVVINMLVAVTVAFIVCWAPFHTQRLMVLYVQTWTPLLMTVQSTLFYISGVLYYVSTTVNPILYNVISRRYRIAFRETICWCCSTNHALSPHASSAYKGYQDRPSNKHPIFTNRDGLVTYQDHHALLHPLTTGNTPGTPNDNLLRDKGNEMISRNISIEDQTTCRGCECRPNGYISSEGTSLLNHGLCTLNHSNTNGILRNGSVV